MGRSSRITDSESDLQTLRFSKKSGLYKDGVFHHLIRADHMHFHANASLTDWQRTLRSTFRSYDLVARFGGDEFAVLCCGCRPGEIDFTIERLRCGMQKLQSDLSIPRPIPTLSIGACVMHDPGEIGTRSQISKLLTNVCISQSVRVAIVRSRRNSEWKASSHADRMVELVLRLRKAGYKIGVAPYACCDTNVPTSWVRLFWQRCRWDRTVITFECRKHADVGYPWNDHFRWSNGLLMFERSREHPASFPAVQRISFAARPGGVAEQGRFPA